MIALDYNQHAASVKKDQRHMTTHFASTFNEEVKADGFMGGAGSYIIAGDRATIDCNIAVSCLVRGNYAVYRTTPFEIVRRLDGRAASLPFYTFDAERLDSQWQSADCYFIFDMFDPDTSAGLTDGEKATLVWFVKQAITGGNVIIIPVSDTDADLNLYGAAFGQFIEQSLEVIHDNEKAPKKR